MCGCSKKARVAGQTLDMSTSGYAWRHTSLHGEITDYLTYAEALDRQNEDGGMINAVPSAA